MDTLKALVTASVGTSAHSVLTIFLNKSNTWKEFKDQSHDLFISDVEKTNHFLIQDSSENRFAGLLTNGSDTVLTTPTNVHADPEPKSRMATNENVEDRSKGHNLERGSNLKSTHTVVSNSVATPYVTSGYAQYQSK